MNDHQYRCLYCSSPLGRGNKTKEHVLPFSMASTIISRKLTCRDCNSTTGDGLENDALRNTILRSLHWIPNILAHLLPGQIKVPKHQFKDGEHPYVMQSGGRMMRKKVDKTFVDNTLLRISGPKDEVLRISESLEEAGKTKPGGKGSWEPVRRVPHETIVPSEPQLIERFALRCALYCLCHGLIRNGLPIPYSSLKNVIAQITGTVKPSGSPFSLSSTKTLNTLLEENKLSFNEYGHYGIFSMDSVSKEVWVILNLFSHTSFVLCLSRTWTGPTGTFFWKTPIIDRQKGQSPIRAFTKDICHTELLCQLPKQDLNILDWVEKNVVQSVGEALYLREERDPIIAGSELSDLVESMFPDQTDDMLSEILEAIEYRLATYYRGERLDHEFRQEMNARMRAYFYEVFDSIDFSNIQRFGTRYKDILGKRYNKLYCRLSKAFGHPKAENLFSTWGSVPNKNITVVTPEELGKMMLWKPDRG